GRFAALLDHFLQHFGDQRVVVLGSAAGPRLDVAVLDRGLGEAERADRVLVAALHRGDGRGLNVVSNHRSGSFGKPPALAVDFSPDQPLTGTVKEHSGNALATSLKPRTEGSPAYGRSPTSARACPTRRDGSRGVRRWPHDLAARVRRRRAGGRP